MSEAFRAAPFVLVPSGGKVVIEHSIENDPVEFFRQQQ